MVTFVVKDFLIDITREMEQFGQFTRRKSRHQLCKVELPINKDWFLKQSEYLHLIFSLSFISIFLFVAVNVIEVMAQISEIYSLTKCRTDERFDPWPFLQPPLVTH